MRTRTPLTPTPDSSAHQSHPVFAPSPKRSCVPVTAAFPLEKPQAALREAVDVNRVLVAAATRNNLLASQRDAALNQTGDLS